MHQSIKDGIDLSGLWAMKLDRDDVGIDEKWYGIPLNDDTVSLPGSLQAQGHGDDVSVDTPWTGQIRDDSWFRAPEYELYRQPGQVKVPFWLQPEKHYVGVAWYQKEIDIPHGWENKRVILFLERPHWQTQVWLDDQWIGSADSLSTPHVYELGPGLTAGRHRLTIRIDNRLHIDVGINAHSVSDHTQSNWNGIVGDLLLKVTDLFWLDSVDVFPNVTNKSIKLTLYIGNASTSLGRAKLSFVARGYNTDRPHQAPPMSATIDIQPGGTMMEVEYHLGSDAHLWDEFDPALYQLEIRLEVESGGQRYTDHRIDSFGLREFKTSGTQFTINGRTTFLRGTLDCAIFPLKGYPPTDIDSWRRILRRVREYGLNHIRFHSWCPPKAAFEAADELGIYYQVECAAWARIGEGEPIDDWLYKEGEHIVRAYGNHPSFTLMAHGNEPSGNHEAYLAEWVAYWRQRDPRRLHTSGAGWPILPENDYHNTPKPRIYRWGYGMEARINKSAPETTTDYRDDVLRWPVPIVSHEIGQWCVFPNFDEIAKYKGVLKPKNFEIFRDFLVNNHMEDQARSFLMASGKHQVLCYKEEIESALRTVGFGGFQLLSLQDFPGQGTALVGVLDPFWDPKPYVDGEAFRRFCHHTVLLARLQKRTFTDMERLSVALEVAHFGQSPLWAAVRWSLMDEAGEPVRQGELAERDIPIGNGIDVVEIEIDLHGLEVPAKYTLVVSLEGTPYENDWDVWVYPHQLTVEPPDRSQQRSASESGVVVTDVWDDDALASLEEGRSVLLLASPEQVKTDVEVGFSTVFWNTAWTNGQPPHTMGILCDPEHPLFRAFPTDYHINWQWSELVRASAAMVFDSFPVAFRPLVQLIDTWFRSHRTGLVFEARIKGGRLVVCSMDISSDLNERIVARQFRHSLLTYMGSDDFQPEIELTVEHIEGLFTRE